METRLFPLEKTFEIGDAEKHTVTVRYTFFARHTIWVDGKEVWNRFNWRSNYSIHVLVGEGERHDMELRVKSRPFDFSIWLDGALYLDALFPEVTAKRLQTEIPFCLAPYLSGMTFILWLALGGYQETDLQLLVIMTACAVAWTAAVIWNLKRPRKWFLFVSLMVLISGSHIVERRTGATSSNVLTLFFTVTYGLLTCLSPWLRRKVTTWHPAEADGT